MNDLHRYALLVFATLATSAAVLCTFVRALRKDQRARYELGSGRVFDRFTTDRGSQLFAASVAAAIAGAVWLPAGLPGLVQDLWTVAYACFCGLLAWTDSMLAAHFDRYDDARPTLLTRGPYAVVRHPRYACWIGLLFSLSLALDSVPGVVTALAFVGVVARRVRLEEHFLIKLYGSRYEDYAARTSRIIPRVW